MVTCDGFVQPPPNKALIALLKEANHFIVVKNSLQINRIYKVSENENEVARATNHL